MAVASRFYYPQQEARAIALRAVCELRGGQISTRRQIVEEADFYAKYILDGLQETE